MQKFLVIQTAFLGDVVLATAVAEKLHLHFPDSQIDFLVRKGNEVVLTGHPFLHEVIIWDKTRNKNRNLLKILGKIRRGKYDTVINIQRFASTGFLTGFSGARRRIGFDKNPLSFLFTTRIKHIINTTVASVHEVERNNLLIAGFTDERILMPRIYPQRIDEEIAQPLKIPPYLTIAPASVWFTKQYPVEKWVSFINKIPFTYTIYILGAPSDSQLANTIREKTAHPMIIDLCGRLRPLQSAALMKDAVMNYANDSAPLHFASAVNAPVTAVYCSTVPSFGYGPLSDVRHIVELQEDLYCRPCGLHGYTACPEGHFLCALKITDDQLLSTLST